MGFQNVQGHVHGLGCTDTSGAGISAQNVFATDRMRPQMPNLVPVQLFRDTPEPSINSVPSWEMGFHDGQFEVDGSLQGSPRALFHMPAHSLDARSGVKAPAWSRQHRWGNCILPICDRLAAVRNGCSPSFLAEARGILTKSPPRLSPYTRDWAAQIRVDGLDGVHERGDGLPDQTLVALLRIVQACVMSRNTETATGDSRR